MKTKPRKNESKKTKATKLKVYGFVLHFGYVESSRVCPLILHGAQRGFESLDAAVTDLAMFFARGYLQACVRAQESYDRYPNSPFNQGRPRPADPTLEEFSGWIYDRPTTIASAGLFGPETWDTDQDESWWPWDTLRDVYSSLDLFYENVEGTGAETILPRFIDPDAMDPQYAKYKTFLAEVREAKVPPSDGDEWGLKLWRQIGDAKYQFKPVRSRRSVL